jgi:DNA transformation protein and related proteins
MADRHRQSAFAEFVLEQLAGVSGVGKRAMFGGFGIYRDGLMFALVADEGLYFKANDHLAEDFIALGLPPFAFMSKGKTVALKYYRAPESVFEDSDQMRHWADKAYRCALRNAETKAGPKRSNRR